MMISLLGATGYVGSWIVQQALAEHPAIQFRIAGRSPSKLETLSRCTNVVSAHVYRHGDIPSPEVLKGSIACIDLTYQSSGIPSDQARLTRAHVNRLVASCGRANARRVILVGSVAVYGEPVISHPWPYAPKTSDLRRPRSTYARMKSLAEASAVDALDRNSGVQLAIIRSGHVLGAGSRMAANIAGGLLQGRCLQLEGRTAPSNATTVEGLADAILHLATAGWEARVLTGNHVNLVEYSYDDVVGYFAESMNARAVSGSTGSIAKANVADRLLSVIRRREARLGVLQSYLPSTRPVVQALKSKAQAQKGRVVVSSGLDCSGLEALYDSDRVPHSDELASPAIGVALREASPAIPGWLTSTGFTFPDYPPCE